jgi:hypothetical protein
MLWKGSIVNITKPVESELTNQTNSITNKEPEVTNKEDSIPAKKPEI